VTAEINFEFLPVCVFALEFATESFQFLDPMIESNDKWKVVTIEVIDVNLPFKKW
jgi:hypothetical protein